MRANLFGHVRADLTWAMRATLPGQDMRTIVSTMDLFKWRRSPSKTGESVLAKIGNWQLAMGFASSLHGTPAPGRDDAIDADLVEPDGNAATRSELAEIAADVNGNPHWDCSAWIGRMRLWAIPARTGREQRQIITRFGRTQPLTAATRIDASNSGSLAAASGDAL